MTNLERYNNIFADVFGVDTTVLNDQFSKDNVESWDSVHQLGIITGLEDTFDLLLDPEDIMACTSYATGIDILKRNNIEL